MSNISMGDSYHKLHEFYMKFNTNLPLRKELIQILKLLFTSEEAELALDIPPFQQCGISINEITVKSGKKETEVRELINSMLEKGVLFMEENEEDGTRLFKLWPLSNALYTPLYGDGIIDDRKRQIKDLREKLWQDGFSYRLYNSRYPLERVLPFEEGIDPKEKIEPYEKISHYIEKAKSICVVACGCRVSSNRCNQRIYTCLHFDKETPYWVKSRGGRLLTKDECLRLAKEAVEEGLVLTGRNWQEMPDAICMCCSDDCVLLRPYNEKHNPHTIAKSNFSPILDKEKCKGCFTCLQKCPVGAIGKYLSHDKNERDRMLIIEERCIGCGVCTAVCTQHALKLKRQRNQIPLQTSTEAENKNMAEQIW